MLHSIRFKMSVVLPFLVFATVLSTILLAVFPGASV